MPKLKRRNTSRRRQRRIVYYHGSLRVFKPNISHNDFQCPKCIHSTKKYGDLYCKAFKHFIEGKIVSCPFFKSRILVMFS